MPFVPIDKDKCFYLIDYGANLNADGEDLYKFALMAKLYMKENNKISNPLIGIFNIGIEQHKDFSFHKKANGILLANKNLNYVGYILPKNFFNDSIDILLTVAKPWNILKLLSSKKIKKYFDYHSKAAAIVFVVNGVIIKEHGSSDEVQFYFTLVKANKCLKNGIINKLNNRNYDV